MKAQVLSRDAAIAEFEMLSDIAESCDIDPNDEYLPIRLAALSDAIERKRDGIVFVL